jgi:hypothetical protein
MVTDITSSSNADATTSDPTPASSEAPMSDYERRRAENIERNNSRLRALGLISKQEECHSNALAWGRQIILPSKTSPPDKDKDTSGKDENTSNKDDNERTCTGTTTNKSRKRKVVAAVSHPSRKSLRVLGQPPDGQTMLHSDTEESIHRSENEDGVNLLRRDERLAWVHECRLVRQQIALDIGLGEGAAERAAHENPTATYGHCLMRVRTMTEKGLANRVKAIERAAGKHCVIKMAIFKSCLQDEDQWELADLAGEALERLKALQPPPE